MLDPCEARRFAEIWIADWNSRDLERILSHFSEEIEFTSPKIIRIMGDPSGRLKGKDCLRAYWSRGLELNPSLHFELIDVTSGVDSVCIHYRSSGRIATEWMKFDSDGKVVSGAAHYEQV